MILAMLIVVVFVLSSSNISTSSRTSSFNAIPYPPFEHFNVRENIEHTRFHEVEINGYDDDNNQESPSNHEYQESSTTKWKLELLHIDKLPHHASKVSNYSHRFEGRMERDAKRVSRMVEKLSSAAETADEMVVEDFGSDVVSGMDEGSGEYFVRIGVGSPARSQYMVIDSGSDILWVQCQPCSQCYQQSDPVFDPTRSASFSGVSCSSMVCERVESSGCHLGRCKYEVSYGDGSYTKGILALETLTFGKTMVKNVVIGCGHSNRGMFVGAAGLLGLGGGSMSLVGQLGGQTGGAFSYCLVSRDVGSSGSLEFGIGILPVGAAWVPLVHNQRAPSFYYIGLSGLGVGGMKVPISENTFQLNELGYGGVVMDTGTAVTRLPTEAYTTFRDAFLAQTSNLPRSPGISIFDTCYDLNGFVTVQIPTVSFFLSGGPILTLPAKNILIPVNERGTFCFAFAPSPSELTIIGNIQQEGIQISIHVSSGYIGFGPNVC